MTDHNFNTCCKEVILLSPDVYTFSVTMSLNTVNQ